MPRMLTRILPCATVLLAMTDAVLGCSSAPTPVSGADRPSAQQPSRGAQSDTPGNTPESNPPGDIPDSQVFVRYTPPRAPFSIEVPEGWARSLRGNEVVFSRAYNSVRVRFHRAATAPTVASVRARDVPAGQVRTVRRNAGPAVLATYRGESDRDPVTGVRVPTAVQRYAFFRAGTEVIVTLSGAVGADNVDPWRRVSDSVRWA